MRNGILKRIANVLKNTIARKGGTTLPKPKDPPFTAGGDIHPAPPAELTFVPVVCIGYLPVRVQAHTKIEQLGRMFGLSESQIQQVIKQSENFRNN